jgi:hypothetical protein
MCLVDARRNMFESMAADGSVSAPACVRPSHPRRVKPLFCRAIVQTAFAFVMQCLARVLKDKIITSENDTIGVMLYGTVSGRRLACGCLPRR